MNSKNPNLIGKVIRILKETIDTKVVNRNLVSAELECINLSLQFLKNENVIDELINDIKESYIHLNIICYTDLQNYIYIKIAEKE